MTNLTELHALRAEIKEKLGLNTYEAVDWIAGALTKSPLTVWGWFNKSQLTPINDNLLELLRFKLREY
jgi:hypothetical protein